MIVLAFILAGLVGAEVVARWRGFRVGRFDVSRRFVTAASWRRAQGIGILYVPLLFPLWALMLGSAAGSRILVETTSTVGVWSIILGVAAVPLTVVWRRCVAFYWSPGYGEQAAAIIRSRGVATQAVAEADLTRRHE